MVGLEVVAGYLIAWGVRKARRVAGRLDKETDAALDAALDHLHEVVAGKLGENTALATLEQETATGAGGPSEPTQVAVRQALESAAEQDARFARDITAAIERLQRLDSATDDQPMFDFRGAKGVQVNNAAGNLQVNRFD